MRHFGMFLALTSAAVSLTGCGYMSGSSSASSSGGMAVVDLDKVAIETGRDRQLAQSLEMQKNSLNQSLAKIVESAKSQLSDKRKEFSEEMTAAEKEKFADWQRSANIQLSQIKNKADQELANYHQKQIADFRAELKPIAQEIASKRGLSIVIPKNEGLLLSVDSGVDITDQVVKVLRERHPVTTANVPPAPAVAPTPAETNANSTATKPANAKRNKTRTANRDDDDSNR